MLAAPVVSDVDVPGFDRATMDGYAVVAASTEGAARLQPAAADGHRRFDAGPSVRPARVAPGQAVRVMTGAPMPRGADAVLPAECVEREAGAADAASAP